MQNQSNVSNKEQETTYKGSISTPFARLAVEPKWGIGWTKLQLHQL